MSGETDKAPFGDARVRLGELCAKGTSSLRQKDVFDDGPYQVYGAPGVIGSMTTYQNEYPYVAIVKDGAGVGRAMLCDGKTSVLGTMQALLPKAGCNREYLLHLVRSLKLGDGFSGSTIPHIYYKDYSKLTVPLYSFEEQEEIAEILGRVERLIRTCNDVVSKLDDLVKSRFVEMFGDGGYPMSRLDFIAEVQGGLTKNSKRDKLPLQLPYLRVANVLSGSLDLAEIKTIGLSEAERDKTLLKPGDLLFVEGNGSGDQIGRSALWTGEIDPCVHQNHLIRARCCEGLLPIYALHYFNSPEGREQIVARAVSTSGLFTLSTGKIRTLEIPVPPLDLQRAFAEFVAEVDKSRTAVQQQIAQLTTLYDSLAQDYFG